MAHYLTRQFVCDRLKLSHWQSYQIVGASYGPRINSDDVLRLLNSASRALPEPLTWIPHDLLKPEELAGELAESDISVHELGLWVRRTKNCPPHFRFTRRTIRFSRSLFMAWLDARSRLKTLKVRVA